MYYWINKFDTSNSPKSSHLFGDFFLINRPLALLFIGCFFLTTSCEQRKKTETTFYNLDSLINAQAQWLTHAKAVYKKTAKLDDHVTRTDFQPTDTSDWRKELEIFKVLAAVNKPANKTDYKVEDGISDTQSNLLIKSISTTNPELPVKYLKLYYLPSPFQLKRIEGYMHKDKVFYKSAGFYTLEFEDIHRQSTIKAFTIHGGQKMLLRDSVTFSVQASVIIL